MPSPLIVAHIRGIVSDAAFKKEADTGHSLRGVLYLRGACAYAQDLVTSPSNVHILDWVSKSQRHVTRSRFAAELLSAGDAIDQGQVPYLPNAVGS